LSLRFSSVPPSRDKLKFVGLEGGQLTSAATHVLMSTAAWQLPANAGEQFSLWELVLSDFCLT